jgi:tetratricopeptide (TPR) repeat protein
MSSWSFWAEDNEAARELSLRLGQRSIELDDTDSLAHALFGEILFDCGQNELAEFHFLRAISLNPNDIAARALYASKLSALGKRDEAIEQLRVAERLDPFGLHWIPWIKGSVMFAARRYEDAIKALHTMSNPPNEAHYVMAAALAMLGRADEAAGYLARYLERARRDMPHYPGDRIEDWRPILDRMLDFEDEADLEHLIQALKRVQRGH